MARNTRLKGKLWKHNLFFHYALLLGILIEGEGLVDFLVLTYINKFRCFSIVQLTRESLLEGRISTIDLLVMTSPDQLLLTLKNIFFFAFQNKLS
jgi:hypothetical protein